MDQLFHDWYRTDLSRRLKHPKIPYRVYTKEISPVIGIKCISEVTARDVREVLERIRESNRPTIANDTLMYMKQLFRHAIKLDLTLNNQPQPSRWTMPVAWSPVKTGCSTKRKFTTPLACFIPISIALAATTTSLAACFWCWVCAKANCAKPCGVKWI